MAGVMSRQVCERCGATSTVRRQKADGEMKTLCEPCGLTWRSVPETVPVRRFTYECYKCGAATPVVYPSGIGGPHGGAWTTVGAEIATWEGTHVEPVFSEVQRQWVYGNCCAECGAYQGNYYVYKAAANRGVAAPTAEADSEIVETIGRVKPTRSRHPRRRGNE